MTRISGKKIVITGASSGIGKNIALEVAKQGGVPILLARRTDKLEELVAQIEKSANVKAYCFKLDISDEQEIATVFASIYEEIGEIDVLINNAGFLLLKNADEATQTEVKELFSVNVFGLIECTKAVLVNMKKKNAGQIVNIASINGKLPVSGASAYVASKHAVLGFTNALRLEMLKTNVQITTINLGPVNTELFEKATGASEQSNNVKKLDPEIVAQKVVATIGTNKRELNLPGFLGFLGKCYAFIPGLMEKLS